MGQNQGKRKWEFRRPNEKEIEKALLTDTEELDEIEKQFFDFKNSSCFQRIPLPEPDDWLSEQREDGQTFDSFKYHPCMWPDATKRTIVIQPFGDFKMKRSIKLEIIKDYMDCFFFSMDTKILPSLTLEEANEIHTMTSRKRKNNNYTQLLTSSVTEFLEVSREKSEDKTEIVRVALIQPYDLYPGEDWNFVFGEASVFKGLGVYSLARFDPLFPKVEEMARKEEGEVKEFSDDVFSLVLKRSLSTVTHEICHLLGMDHCIYFSCVMNGSNHLEESDSMPLFLCPVCLKKLCWSLKFSCKKRYEEMKVFFTKYGIEEEQKWIDDRFEEVKVSRK